MSDKTSEKTFLLCVGAHKAGTTWLHRYLEQHDNVCLGFMKEYHVFDALTSPEGQMYFDRYITFAKERLEDLERGLNQYAPKMRSLRQNIFKMADFLADYNNYFNYFSNILHSRANVVLTGDVTPAYCSLSPDVLELIKTSFAERGVSVKTLFLLRDPVNRCISASQYNMGRWKKDREIRNSRQPDFDRIVRKDYEKFGFEERARYDVTIRNLESVFDKDHVYYEFYEKLFRTDSIQGICGYLGIPYREVDFDERVNESKMKFVVSESVRAELFAHYAPVYEFIHEKFSKDFIDRLWTSHERGEAAA